MAQVYQYGELLCNRAGITESDPDPSGMADTITESVQEPHLQLEALMRPSLALVFLLCLAVPASAQDCTISAYADRAGTLSQDNPDPLVLDSFYVVIFAEATVAGAAYSIEIPDGVIVQARFTGPSGAGLVIDEPTGTSAALGECVVGFGALPVLVDEYRYIALYPMFHLVTLGPNASQDPEFPQYVTCNDMMRDCEAGSPLFLGHGDAVYETSFSAVKALYY